MIPTLHPFAKIVATAVALAAAGGDLTNKTSYHYYCKASSANARQSDSTERLATEPRAFHCDQVISAYISAVCKAAIKDLWAPQLRLSRPEIEWVFDSKAAVDITMRSHLPSRLVRTIVGN